MSPNYYSTSTSGTAPHIVDVAPARTSRASSARVCYHSSPTPLPTYTYTRVVVVKKCSKVNSKPKHTISSFERDFAGPSSGSYTTSQPQYRESAQPNRESNHYSLSRWANENTREAPPYYAPRSTQPSYAQRRYESESSREQPWNAVREVHIVRAAEPRDTRTVRRSTPNYSVAYYDPSREQLGGGGRTGAAYRSTY